MCFVSVQQKLIISVFPFFSVHSAITEECTITTFTHFLVFLENYRGGGHEQLKKVNHVLFSWQKTQSELLLCRWVFPCSDAEPPAVTRCTTARQTWSRRTHRWSHLSVSCSQVLWSHSDAGWRTTIGSVPKALRKLWKQSATRAQEKVCNAQNYKHV